MSGVVNGGHWVLWAVSRRESTPHIGYPRQTPFYQPPRRGNVDDGAAERELSDYDFQVVDWIESAMVEAPATERWVLVEYHGAYVGAPHSMGERWRRIRTETGMARHAAETFVKAAQRGVERYIEAKHGGS